MWNSFHKNYFPSFYAVGKSCREHAVGMAVGVVVHWASDGAHLPKEGSFPSSLEEVLSPRLHLKEWEESLHLMAAACPSFLACAGPLSPEVSTIGAGPGSCRLSVLIQLACQCRCQTREKRPCLSRWPTQNHFWVTKHTSRTWRKSICLDFRRANFGLFKDLFGWVPWWRAWREQSRKHLWAACSNIWEKNPPKPKHKPKPKPKLDQNHNPPKPETSQYLCIYVSI